MTKRWIGMLLVLAPLVTEARGFKEICDSLEPISKLSGLRYVKPTVRVAPKTPGVTPQSVVFNIEAKSGAIKVPVGADGTIAFPLSKALCEENPETAHNQPPGSVGISVGVDVWAPPAKAFDYRLIMDMRADWDEAIKRQNLMYRMLAPSAKAAVIHFEPGRTAVAEIRLPQGPQKLTANEKGEIRIAFDETWRLANPTIELSELPKKIGLSFK